MIVFDASALVSAALRPDGVPERALVAARRRDVLALSRETDAEIADVLSRPRFVATIGPARFFSLLSDVRQSAEWFEPTERVTDCRDSKDNKYLELALVSGAQAIATGDADLLVLDPWRGVRIIRPVTYLAEMGERPRPPLPHPVTR